MKKVFLFVSLLLATLILTACGKQPGTTRIETYTDEGGNVQTKIVTDDDTFGGGGKRYISII